MPLQKQNIPIIFGRGLDTKTEEKVVQADKMLELENAVFTKKMSFSTRYGSTKLGSEIVGSTSSIANPKKLMTFQDELLLVADNKLYSYVPSSKAWASRGSISAVAVESESIMRNTRSQSVPDINTLLGVSVYAWEEASGIYASVIDENSGLPVLSGFQIAASGVKPKVFASTSYLLVYWLDGNTLKVRKLNPLQPTTFDAAFNVAADVADNFDVTPCGQNLVFIYNKTGGGCLVGYLTKTGEIGSALTGFPTPVSTPKDGDSAVAIVAKFDNNLTDRIFAFYSNTTDGLCCSIYGLNLYALGAIDVIGIYVTANPIRNITGLYFDQNTVRFYYEDGGSPILNTYIRINTIDIAGSIGSNEIGLRSLGLISKAFYGADNNIYLVAGSQSTYQSTYFIMRDTLSTEKLQVASVVAKYEGAGITAKASSLCNVVNFKFPNLIKTQLQSETGAVYSLVGVQSTSMDFTDTKLFNFKELGKNTHIAGGMLYDYDGVTAFEHGFHFFPEDISEFSPTSGSIAAGTYQYCFCYEWTDNQGQIHRSAPSIPFTKTFGSGSSGIIFSVETLKITRRTALSGRSEVQIVGYRTEASKTTFYRFTSLTSPSFNSTTSGAVLITDTSSDATIRANDVLYTTGGVLENYSPGAARLVEEYRNRLVVAGLEDSTLVRYSQERQINVAMDFAEELSFRNDSGKGDIEAIARLDEKLIIFKANDIYYQIGQGPTATGAQDDYQQPIFITTDVGTLDQQSVVSMPLGLMFKTAKGYYLLTRSLEPIYIGQEVEKYNGLKVTSAILCDDFNEVRFTHFDGVCLVYNYNQGQWSVFNNKEALSAVLWQNKWTLLKTNNTVVVEDKDTFFDDNIPVTKKITTAWIQAASLQGAQRIYRVMFIGKLKSKHRLKIELAYDFDPSIRETFYFDTETILGSSYYGEGYYGEENYYGGADPVYQIEIRPGIQKCQAIRFTLQDLNDDAVDGAGFELTGMTIQVGAKQGLFRTNIDKRVGPSA